jgi:hypothetical protein
VPIGLAAGWEAAGLEAATWEPAAWEAARGQASWEADADLANTEQFVPWFFSFLTRVRALVELGNGVENLYSSKCTNLPLIRIFNKNLSQNILTGGTTGSLPSTIKKSQNKVPNARDLMIRLLFSLYVLTSQTLSR